ncbi:MAG: hypothetical protein K8R88_10885 [Armatimonadetes bacterium]|nr:hypothetical protein [Armatimonadota bacterium]
MAKMSPSVLIQGLKGSSGSVVFQDGKDGIIVRVRVKGTNPDTAAQQAVRAALTTASRQYKGLTTPQVQAWEAYAEANAPAYDSAINAFVKLGVKYILANGGGTAPVTPPTAPFTGDTPKITVAVSTGKLTFTATAANAANVATELLFQPLKSKNRKPQAKAYKTGAYVSFKVGTLSADVVVPTGYYAAGYRFVSLATGQTTHQQNLTVPGPVTFSVSETEGKKKAA